MNRRQAIKRAAGGLLGAIGAISLGTQTKATAEMWIQFDQDKIRQYTQRPHVQQQFMSGNIDSTALMRHIVRSHAFTISVR